MIANNFFLAERNPVAMIGFAIATEGMGSNLASNAATIISENCDFAPNVCSFLKVHGEEDIEHLEYVKAAFERYADSPEDRDVIMAAWRYTVHSYAQLFTDALGGTELPLNVH